VCADGSPHATPLGWWAFDFDKGEIVFDNRAETVHGRNLARDQRCFITIVNYDQSHSRAVYVKTVAQKLTGDKLDHAADLIISRGGKKDGEIWSARLGELDETKTEIRYDEDGSSRRFHCYFVDKEGK
jgi:hypothetical protein